MPGQHGFSATGRKEPERAGAEVSTKSARIVSGAPDSRYPRSFELHVCQFSSSVLTDVSSVREHLAAHEAVRRERRGRGRLGRGVLRVLPHPAHRRSGAGVAAVRPELTRSRRAARVVHPTHLARAGRSSLALDADLMQVRAAVREASWRSAERHSGPPVAEVVRGGVRSSSHVRTGQGGIARTRSGPGGGPSLASTCPSGRAVGVGACRRAQESSTAATASISTSWSG